MLAMPCPGVVRFAISTDAVELNAEACGSHASRRPGHFVRLSVSDTGCGMDEATLKRIFEPFFTTKEVGKGTGLGLATVYGIVNQHRGWLEVQSKVNAGSTFFVFLPALANAPREGAAPETPLGIGVGGHETILLVEDELSVRRSLCQCLRVFGYRVLEAGTAKEALALWPVHRQDIALLFTDMVMPEGDTGLELAEQLRKQKPDLKVIISSGYSSEMADRGLPPQHGIVYLPKPFKARSLGSAVRACLDQK